MSFLAKNIAIILAYKKNYCHWNIGRLDEDILSMST